MAVASPPTYDEVLEFLLTGPGLAEIIMFRPSDSTQARVRDLLEANRLGTISPDEVMELDAYQRIEHLVRLLKIKAHEKQAEQ